MSDFHQIGSVTALPRLVARPVEDLESQVLALSRRFPVALVIPMVPSEMDRPALAAILDELVKVPYLDALVVSLNKASALDHLRCHDFFARYPGRKVILWNEAPALQELLEDMHRRGLYVGEPGKGRACWLAMGYVLAEERVEYLAFHDADVRGYSREILACLLYTSDAADE